MDAVDTIAWLRADGAPWHGKGRVLEDTGLTSMEVMKTAGLDWRVELRPLYYPILNNQELKDKGGVLVADNEIFMEKSASQELVRADTGGRLNTVGPQFTPVQNHEAFEFMDKAVGEDIEYRVAGALMGGQIVFILASLPEFMKIKDEDVMQYLLFVNSHGWLSCRVQPTPIRTVCWNTLNMALKQADKSQRGVQSVVKFRHTSRVKDRLFDYAKILALVRELYQKTSESFNALADTPVNEEDVDNFVEYMHPINPEAKNTTRTENNQIRLRNAFEGEAPGSTTRAARGTAWGLYNAATYVADHVRGSDKNRLRSAWFGSGEKFKEKALNYNLELANRHLN